MSCRPARSELTSSVGCQLVAMEQLTTILVGLPPGSCLNFDPATPGARQVGRRSALRDHAFEAHRLDHLEQLHEVWKLLREAEPVDMSGGKCAAADRQQSVS